MSLLKVIYHTKKTTHGLTKNIICDNFECKILLEYIYNLCIYLYPLTIFSVYVFNNTDFYNFFLFIMLTEN